MLIQKLLSGCECLSVIQRGNCFCVVDHEQETVEYYDSLVVIVSRTPHFTVFDLIDQGVAVLASYKRKGHSVTRAWLAGRNNSEPSLRAGKGVRIETLHARKGTA